MYWVTKTVSVLAVSFFLLFLHFSGVHECQRIDESEKDGDDKQEGVGSTSYYLVEKHSVLFFTVSKVADRSKSQREFL